MISHASRAKQSTTGWELGESMGSEQSLEGRTAIGIESVAI
jgi:hypothetical protein